MKNALLITLISIFLGACSAGKPLSTQTAGNNDSYEVEYLFEHDGCKVYRFYDKRTYVYFTNCSGEVSKMEGDSLVTQTYNTVLPK